MRTLLISLLLIITCPLFAQVDAPAWHYATQEEKQTFDQQVEETTGFNFRENLPASKRKSIDVILLLDGKLVPAMKTADNLKPYGEEDDRIHITLDESQKESLLKELRKLELSDREKKDLTIMRDVKAGQDLARRIQRDLFVSPAFTYNIRTIDGDDRLRVGPVHAVTDGIDGLEKLRYAMRHSLSFSQHPDQREKLIVLDKLRERYADATLPSEDECEDVLDAVSDSTLSAGEAEEGFYTLFTYGKTGDYRTPPGATLAEAKFVKVDDGKDTSSPDGDDGKEQPVSRKAPEEKAENDGPDPDTSDDAKSKVVNNYYTTNNYYSVTREDDETEQDSVRRDTVVPEHDRRFVVMPSAGFVPASNQDRNEPAFTAGAWAGYFVTDNIGVGAGFNLGGFEAKIPKKYPPRGDLRGKGYIQRDGTYTGWEAVVAFRQEERRDFMVWASFGIDSYNVTESSYHAITDLEGNIKNEIEITVDDNLTRTLPRLGVGIGVFASESITLGVEAEFYIPGSGNEGWQYSRAKPDGTKPTAGGGSAFYPAGIKASIGFSF